MNNVKLKSKKIRVSAGERLSDLSALGDPVFHTDDVANLWGITNKNTLHTMLSRYVAGGFIHRIYKGLYAVKKIKEINPLLLGVKALHSSAYISCETILYQNGVLNQSPREVTLVSGFSRRFSVVGVRYRSRKMHDEFLFNDAGIEIKDMVRVASLSRAVADMLYFNPNQYLDSGDSGLIDWGKVKEISDTIGYDVKIPNIKI